MLPVVERVDKGDSILSQSRWDEKAVVDDDEADEVAEGEEEEKDVDEVAEEVDEDEDELLAAACVKVDDEGDEQQ